MSDIQSLCLLGFGEVGTTLATALIERQSTQAIDKNCFDLKARDADFVEANRSLLSAVNLCVEPLAAVKDVDLVISAVTAEQDLTAARLIADGLKPGAWFLDLNSVSPDTKKNVAEVIERAGGRYVEATIMSPIHPLGIESPILLGGPRAEGFLPLLQQLGFSGASFYSEQLGKTAASKMCRSVMIKGLEALLTESLLSARFYGVEREVLNSLSNILPGIDWNQQAAYMISRSLEHGERRAEEMREAAVTVVGAGLLPRMSRATAETQQWTAQFGRQLATQPLLSILDEILTRHRNNNSSKC